MGRIWRIRTWWGRLWIEGWVEVEGGVTEFADRRFQLWYYAVNHGVALIRSPKKGPEDENIDLVFHGVSRIDAVRHMGSIAEIQTTESEEGHVAVDISLTSGGVVRVVAAFFSVERNKRGLFSVPFDCPFHSD